MLSLSLMSAHFSQPCKPHGCHNSKNSIYVLNNGHVSDTVITAHSAGEITALGAAQIRNKNRGCAACQPLEMLQFMTKQRGQPNVDVAPWQAS